MAIHNRHHNAVLPRKITDTVAKEQNEEKTAVLDATGSTRFFFASIFSNGKRFFLKRGELDFEFSMQNFIFVFQINV